MSASALEPPALADALAKALPSGPLYEEDDDFDSDGDIAADIANTAAADAATAAAKFKAHAHAHTAIDLGDLGADYQEHIRQVRTLEASPRTQMRNLNDDDDPFDCNDEEVPVVDGTELDTTASASGNGTANSNTTTSVNAYASATKALGHLELVDMTEHANGTGTGNASGTSTPNVVTSPELLPVANRRNSRGNRNSYSRLPTNSDDTYDAENDEFYVGCGDDTATFLRQPGTGGGTGANGGGKQRVCNVESNKSKSSRAIVTSRLKKGFKAVKRASAKSTASAGKSISAAWRANQGPPKPSHEQAQAQNSADREEWLHSVLPGWKKRRRAARTRVLMFRGIPSSVRGLVWQTALGNPLNVSADLYEVLKERALAGRAEYTRFQEICANGGDLNGHGMLEHQRSAHKAILLDLPRTFPGLAFFHADGSNYEDALRDILEAFVYLRPDVGYSQGMSFLAAVLLLFMEPPEAFSCFVNMLLYKSCFLQFFRIQMPDVRIYLDVHSRLLAEEMPALHAHFVKHAVEPDIYMINWVMSLYCRALPLDLVSRIWDIYVFDGDVAIFRAALGILKLLQSRLLVMNFEEIAYSLSHLPTDDIQDDALMHTIRSVRVVTKKKFKELYRECQVKYIENPQAK